MPSWIRVRHREAQLLGALVVVVAIAFAALVFVGSQTSTILSTVGAAIPPSSVSGGGTVVPGGNGTQGPAAVAGQRVAMVDVSRPDLFIVRTGSLDLQVADVPRAVDAATREVEAAGGYLSGSEQTGEDAGVSASATYRIPVDAWTPTLAAIRSLATKVVAARIRTEDVTAEVVDLRARIANLEASERALQAIMSQATKVDDVLRIQEELTSVRGAIEEAVARKKQFEDQAAFSTLSVRFGLKPVAAVVATQERYDPASEVDRASARLVHLLQHAASAAIWFGIVWLPFILVVGIGALGAIALYRSRRRASHAVDGVA